MTGYSPEQVAAVCHDANRRLQVLLGDPAPSVPWECETDEIRESAVAGVRAVLGGAAPEGLHEEWCRVKRAAGFAWGPEKDAGARTHPFLIPFAIVTALREGWDVDFGQSCGLGSRRL